MGIAELPERGSFQVFLHLLEVGFSCFLDDLFFAVILYDFLEEWDPGSDVLELVELLLDACDFPTALHEPLDTSYLDLIGAGVMVLGF